MQVNLNMSQGIQYTIEKKNLFRDELVSLPESLVVLHAEVVMDGDVEGLEVWLAIPNTSGTSTPTPEAMNLSDLPNVEIKDEDSEFYY